MRRLRVVAVVAIAVVAGATWWLMQRDHVASRPPVTADPSAPAESPSQASTESRSDRRLMRPRAFSESEPAEPESVPEGALAIIRGRCVDPAGGAPLGGCKIELHGWVANSGRLDAFVKDHGPVAWSDPPDQVTRKDGGFEVGFLPPDPYQFMLTISGSGRATMQGRWFALKPGEIVDLGDVMIPAGTVLRGKVIDEGGTVKPGITVSLSRHDDRKQKLAPRSWHQQVTRSDGTFVFADPLSGGSFSVDVQGADLVEPRAIDIRASEATLSVDIRVRAFSEADAISGVVKDDRGDPVAKASVQYFSPRVGSRAQRMLESGKDGSFRIQKAGDDPREPVTISVRCTGYESSEGLTKYEWGRKDVTITLRKGATVTVVVRDGDFGKPLERFGVRCFGTRGPGARAADATRLRNRGEHPNGVLELGGVLRGRQFLVIEPEGAEWLPSRGQEFEATEDGAPLQEVTVWRAVKKTVLVRSQDGKPVAGTKLELLRPVAGRPVDLKTRALEVSELSKGFWQCAFLLDVGQTDEEGTLEMRGAPNETLVLRALGPGHAPVTSEVRFDGAEATIAVVVQKGATLVGKILPLEILSQLDGRGPEDAGREHERHGIGVALRLGIRGSVEFPLGHAKAPIESDGTFRIDGVPPGTWSVDLHYLDGPQGVKQSGTSIYSYGSGSMQIGKFDLVDGEERHETFDLTKMLKAELEGILTIDGKPVEGGALAFDGLVDGSSDDRLLAQQIGIGSDGAFKALVWPARYRLIVQTMRDGKRRCVQTPELLALAAGEKLRRTFDFPSSLLELRIVASDGLTPIAGALLDIQVPAPSWPGSAERTDAQGRTSVLDLPAGPVTISAWPKNLSTPEGQREFFGSGTKREDVLLPVATVVVAPPNTKATIVLPPSAGY